MTLPSRPAQPSDAVSGVVPRVVFTPSTLDEAAGAMELTAREDVRVAFIGAGTELGLGAPPRSIGAVIRTEKLARILDYSPDDMVITVEAGTTLAQVREATRAKGQMLALDPPRPERSIGGMIATGAFGPARARYGTLRDLILGVTIVRADGVVVKGGGKVVKNVAGFDLPKIVCGSLGTLGMIATATFRLHPLPERTATVLFEGLSAAAVVERIAKLREARREPARLIALRAGDRYDLAVSFEGFARGVAHQIEGLDAAPIDEDALRARHDAARSGPFRIKLASLPSMLGEVDRALAPLLAALRAPAFAWYGSLGIGFLAGELDDLAAARTAIEGLRQTCSVVLEAGPNELAVDRWGPIPALALMAAMKRRFDPESRLNPGRFVGGL